MRTSEAVDSRQRITDRDAMSTRHVGELANPFSCVRRSLRRRWNPPKSGDAVHRYEQRIIPSANRFSEFTYEPLQGHRFRAAPGFGTPDDDRDVDSSERVPYRSRHRIDVDIAAGQDFSNLQRA
jgi:hypothetical protein